MKPIVEKGGGRRQRNVSVFPAHGSGNWPNTMIFLLEENMKMTNKKKSTVKKVKGLAVFAEWGMTIASTSGVQSGFIEKEMKRLKRLGFRPYTIPCEITYKSN